MPEREVANVIESQIVFDRARSIQWMNTVAGHARRELQAHFNERMPRKLPIVEITGVFDEEDED